VSIVFGLLFGTVLILLVVPAMLMLIEEQRDRFRGLGPHLAPANWGELARRAWRFDPIHYRQQAGPQGLGGHLWWVMILGPWLLLTILGKLPLLLQALKADAGPLLVAPTGLLWLVMTGLGAAFLWHLFRRRQQAGRLALYWLLVTGFGSLLIAALAPLAGLQGELLAGAFWSQARWSLVTALIVLPLLFWSRRSAQTLTS
jgi:hypothetical protein